MFLVDSVSILPSLSDIVKVSVNTISSQTKQVARNTPPPLLPPFTKKADWDQFKQTMRDFQSELLTDLATTNVLWDKFASRLESKALINLSLQGKLLS